MDGLTIPLRSLSAPAERDGLLVFPAADGKLIRYHALSESDFAVIRQRRGNRNRLGFALKLCCLC
jgi:hypothetical protein